MVGVPWRQLLLLLLLLLLGAEAAHCPGGHFCSGHGHCNRHHICACAPGYTGPDCSLRTCPYAPAWSAKPHQEFLAHREMECANNGMCDRSTGQCQCFPGFGGNACQRSLCPNKCSGRGTCLTISDINQIYYEDLRPLAEHDSDPDFTYSNWDSQATTACVCDLGYSGASCEIALCPKGDDPLTPKSGTYSITISTGADTFLDRGKFRFKFNGLSFLFPAHAADFSATDCKNAFESLRNVDTALCTRSALNIVGGATYTVTVTKFSETNYDSNIYSNDGSPTAEQFKCEGLSIPMGYNASCQVTVQAANGVIGEYMQCSNRGVCNYYTGSCICHDNFVSPSCGQFMPSTDGTFVDFKDTTLVQSNHDSFTKNVFRITTAALPVSVFNYIKISVLQKILFTLDSNGDIEMNFGGLKLLNPSNGFVIKKGGLKIGIENFDNPLSGGRIKSGGLRIVSGSGNLISGGIAADQSFTVTGGLTVYNGGVIVSDGVQVMGGGMRLLGGGGLFARAGGMTISSGGIQVLGGGISVASGGIVVTQKGMTIHTKGISITGGLTLNALTGGYVVTGGMTIFTGGMRVTGGLSLGLVGLSLTGGFTIFDSGISIPDSLTIFNSGLSVTGGLSIASGGLYISSGVTLNSGGLLLADGGIAVTNGATIFDSGAVVSGGMTVAGVTGMFIMGGLTVDSAGLAVTRGATVGGGGLLVPSANVMNFGVKATRGVTINSGGLYSTMGMSVLSNGLFNSGYVSVATGGVKITGGLTILNGALAVTQAVTISAGGLVCAGYTGAVTINSLGLRVSGGMTVVYNGLRVTGAITLAGGGGLNIIGGVSIKGNGIVVSTAGLTLLSSGLAVTGGVTVAAGGVGLVSGSVSIANNGIQSAGIVRVNTGGIIVTGGLTVATAGVYAFSSLSVEGAGLRLTGGLTLNNGGIYCSGGVSINNGGMIIGSGGLFSANNGATFVGDTIFNSGGVNVVGGLTIGGSGVDVTGRVTISLGGLFLTDGLTIRSSGLYAIHVSSVQDSGIIVDGGGLTIQARGLVVTGGATLNNVGATITGGVTIRSGGLFVTGGISNKLGGVRITGGLTLLNIGLNTATSITIRSIGIDIVQGGITINSGGIFLPIAPLVYKNGVSTPVLTITAGGLTVSQGMSVMNGGVYVDNALTLTGASSLSANLLVSGGFIADQNVNVIGGLNQNSHDGLTISDSGLFVSTGGVTVYGLIQLQQSPTVFSDQRLKENITEIENSLGKLSKIRGVYYNWKNPNVLPMDNSTRSENATSYRETEHLQRRQVGVIAQAVQESLPEAVFDMEGGKYLGVQYEAVVPLLVDCVNMIRKRVDSQDNCYEDHKLDREVDELQERILSARAEQRALETLLARLEVAIGGHSRI